MLQTQDDHGVVLVCGILLAQDAAGDRLATAHAMVSLVEHDWAGLNDVAWAVGCCPRTWRRHQCRFETGSVATLGRALGDPHVRPRVATTRRRLVEHLNAQGHSQRKIARRLGVGENAMRKLLRRLGWPAAATVQRELLLPETEGATAVPAPVQTAHPNLSAIGAASAPARPATNGEPEFIVRTYDTSSSSLFWQDRYNPAGGNDAALATTISAGSVRAVDFLTSSPSDSDWFVRVYASNTGAIQRIDQYDQSRRSDLATAFAPAGSKVFVAGEAANTAANADWLTRADSVK